jgi:hypothetical protein
LAENKIKDIAGLRIQNMMNEYLTSSFMSANEKFDQNMVFETQLEEIDVKKEEEQYQELFDKKLNPFSQTRVNSSQENTLNIQGDS